MGKNTHGRFERMSNPPRMRLTLRDIQILQYAGQYRLVSSKHFFSLMKYESRQGILRRLHFLYHHGYLDRPKIQVQYFHSGANNPMVYALGRKGVTTLKAEGCIEEHTDHWAQRRKELKGIYFEHRLGITDCLVHIQNTLPDSIHMNLLTGSKKPLRSNAAASLKWQVQLERRFQNKRVGVIPDAAFLIEDETSKSRILYFLEYDRGTMPIKRKTLDVSSFYKKLIAYHCSWKQKIPQSQFECNRIRVLTLTSSEERCRRLRELADSLNDGKGSGLFVFRSRDEFLNSNDPLNIL